jgi:hypothetical protein
MNKIFIFASLMLLGCASTSAIAPYGKDTFILSVSDSMGVTSSSELKVKAAQDANAHCAKLGKVMTVRNSSAKGSQWYTSTSSDLIFSCISEDDSENVRPNLKRAPDTVIEVQTK